jgi:branched-chain amino acid aminotransferase
VKVWLDGEIVEGDAARIPVTDHGVLYGDGVFEGIRAQARRVFRLDRYLDRLQRSARALSLEIPGGSAQARRVVLETVRAYGQPAAYIRLVVTRGEGALGVDPTTCPKPRMFCIVGEIALFPEEKRTRGLDLVTSSLRRPSPDVLDTGAKTLNYLNNALAKLEARQRGADDALLLNAAGHVAEATVANVFAVRRGVLRTPPASDGALEGITREAVLELAAELGVPSEERTLGRMDLFAADEVFLTGTGAGIVPVASLDGRPLGWSEASPTPRPVLARLQQAFAELIARDGAPF